MWSVGWILGLVASLLAWPVAVACVLVPVTRGGRRPRPVEPFRSSRSPW
jgi:hypothetical protein